MIFMKKLTSSIQRFLTEPSRKKKDGINAARRSKIGRGANDFATRFEKVMRDLANG